MSEHDKWRERFDALAYQHQQLEAVRRKALRALLLTVVAVNTAGFLILAIAMNGAGQ